jgi:hypothetical protein
MGLRLTNVEVPNRQSRQLPPVASFRAAVELVLSSLLLLPLLLTLLGRPAYAAIAGDVVVAKDTSNASTTITTPAFNTISSNELLLAFVATDYASGTNTTVTSIAGGGLTWTLVKRANAQSGTARSGARIRQAPSVARP